MSVIESDPQPKPPTGLGPRGTALWQAITSKYLLNVSERQTLIDAAHECDVIEMLQVALDERGLVTTGSRGQDAPSPALVELRLHRQCLAKLLTSLRLPDEGGTSLSRQQQASEQARRAVRARWDRVYGRQS